MRRTGGLLDVGRTILTVTIIIPIPFMGAAAIDRRPALCSSWGVGGVGKGLHSQVRPLGGGASGGRGWQGLTSKCSLGTWGRQEGVLRTQKMRSAGAAAVGERPNGTGQKDRVVGGR